MLDRTLFTIQEEKEILVSEMKSQAVISVFPEEIKSCLDEFDKLYKPSCFSSEPIGITNLRRLYASLADKKQELNFVTTAMVASYIVQLNALKNTDAARQSHAKLLTKFQWINILVNNTSTFATNLDVLTSVCKNTELVFPITCVKEFAKIVLGKEYLPQLTDLICHFPQAIFSLYQIYSVIKHAANTYWAPLFGENFWQQQCAETVVLGLIKLNCENEKLRSQFFSKHNRKRGIELDSPKNTDLIYKFPELSDKIITALIKIHTVLLENLRLLQSVETILHDAFKINRQRGLKVCAAIIADNNKNFPSVLAYMNLNHANKTELLFNKKTNRLLETKPTQKQTKNP